MLTKSKILWIEAFIQQQLKLVEERENIKIDFKLVNENLSKVDFNMSITSLDFDPKIEKLNHNLSVRYGFTQNIVGMDFNHPKLGLVQITEIKTRNRKYPIIGQADKGYYKFTPHQIKNYLGGDKLINRNKNLELLLDSKEG
jgi:uncharacterized membrane-anchored protein